MMKLLIVFQNGIMSGTNFSELSMVFSAGSNIVNVKSVNRTVDEEKLKHVFENDGLKVTEKQKINLIEAALIRYFEPEYNIKFKENFPNSKHTSYSDCYKLDIRAVNLELDTSEMIRKIYTRKSGRKAYHSKMFEFASDEDRISFLNII